jgi:preprotein translocase subunit SecA
MITVLLKKVFGSRNERLLKQYRRTVRAVNALEPQIATLSDDQLRAKTEEFRERIRKAVAAPESPAAAAEQATEIERRRRAALDRGLLRVKSR